jgi:hypothetical protein
MTSLEAVLLTVAVVVFWPVFFLAGLYTSAWWQRFQDIRVWRSSPLDRLVMRVMDSAWWQDRQDRKLTRWARREDERAVSR